MADGHQKPTPDKPLGRKAYGSIPHLPGSRMGPADHHCHPGQEAICTVKARDRHDEIFVTEKLDGSNVCIANVGGEIHALGRAGFPSVTSPYEQHHHFAAWVRDRDWRRLPEGAALHGEWLAQAHGTIYGVEQPFVAFDLTTDGKRRPYAWLETCAALMELPVAKLLHRGPPIPIAQAMDLLGALGHHGATEQPEGIVYRVERRGAFDFLAKYVRPDKVDGKYLPEISGAGPVWMWRHPSINQEKADG